MALFLDRSYLLALELANDGNHQAARKHWLRIVGQSVRLVITSYVLAEVVTFLNTRGHHAKAVRIGNGLLRSPSVQLVHVDEALFYEGWDLFQKQDDKSYSLTECISFSVMRARKIGTALAFDKHFVQAGLTI